MMMTRRARACWVRMGVAGWLAGGTALDAATLQLDPPWGEHMVVQADRPAHPSGQARPQAEVRIRFRQETVTTRADNSGRWQLELSPAPAGGPHTMVVESGGERVEWADVLVGEVWLAAGQSNMEWTLGPTRHAQASLAVADRPRLRLFTVPHNLAPARGGAFEGDWRVCTPDSARDFSAVAYHFGVELQHHRPGPVGLITAAWGGTPGETWTPVEAIKPEPELAPILARWGSRPLDEQRMYLDGLPFDLQLRNLHWQYTDGHTEPISIVSRDVNASHDAVTQYDPGRYHGRVAGGGWATAHGQLAEGTETVDLRDVKGLGFEARGRCSFDAALVQAGPSDGDYHAIPRFDLTSDWRPYRFNVSDLRQGGWGEPHTLDLAATRMLAFRVQAPSQLPDQPGLLFDAMVRPLHRAAVRGVLWYQGESNLGRHQEYQVLLQALVTGWRAVFENPELAFLVVQLPDFGAPGADENGGEGFPPFRLAQAEIEALPHTGLAVTLGLGAGTDWHPRHKRPVGRRLAWEALRVAYQAPGISGTGPVLAALTREGDDLVAAFVTVGKLAVDGDRLRGFEWAGEDGRWQPAEARLVSGRVQLPGPWGSTPTAIRYAWGDNPMATLRDTRGLPALPFVRPIHD